MKILGIDDNTEINDMLRDVLTPAGHEYQSVTNGTDGLKLLQEQAWDVVLLDISMPEVSGRDVLQELAKNHTIKKQAVIMFTAANISSDDVNEMLELGVYCCLRKPMSITNLLEILENIKNKKDS